MPPAIEAEVIPSPFPTRGRQHIKAACDECRRRKLRCDGQQPLCGGCQDSGSICEVTQRGTRGPKKGYIKALKNRVVHLEAMLESHNDAQQQQQSQQRSTESSSDVHAMPIVPPVEIPDTTVVDHAQLWLPTTPAPEALLPTGCVADLGSLSDWSLSSTLSSTPDALVHITDIMRDELDQLYFDRVHPSIPIIHQRRYALWSKTSPKLPSRTCLQYAMWTLATLFSAQFRDMTEPLYHKAKHLMESPGTSDANTELVQAWVLIATCESMRTRHRQAWMSAGQAFRLVQGMRFHEIDRPKNSPRTISPPESEDSIGTEEKRRVFWMAYLLDHLFSMRNNWPLTLHEHVVCTRLPAPDVDFQSGQQVLGAFLSEAMTEPTPKVRSPFNECLILATICGRSLLRGQQYNISKAYGEIPLDWTEQRWWLDGILTTRLQVLSQCYPSPNEVSDPLLLFANILAQATVIYYCKGIMSLFPTPVDHSDASPEVMECVNRALTAAADIVRLAKMLLEFHFSKIHPLMPIPLFLSAEFLYDNMSGYESFRLCLQNLIDIFGRLKNVNNHEQSYVDLLPQSCVSKTTKLLDYSSKGRDSSQ
ncbi:Zn(II)2Cys6 transcription factor [Aspergillus ibericus CBS 121593]|uniref:Zn(2)-C6 fungal-type domain-containing protein n=1 Tax=Aspergillus ibericus CBS 121593 TaxID=1448316 RepID=A0A395GXC4_9EURO|nr:hypothetical protein BO80DRAFT_494340 [Aspergillus ibericus CBS 121593]RAL00197.1 hypothetical protein BO80DRAFT_494340 [Aspergillus ibericus CBS 121593]